MTTLAQLVVTWIYIWITTDSDITPDGYIERPGFLIGDRVSIDHLDYVIPCEYGPGDEPLACVSAGWHVILMGRLIAKTETLEDALTAANALNALVQQDAIHGSMRIQGDAMYIHFDSSNVEVMHQAIMKALTV